MEKFLGNFLKEFPPEHDSLELTFTPSSQSLKKRWQNNRLSAYFVADYFSGFLPIDETEERDRIKEGKAAVSYIANELLENAIKFHSNSANCKIIFGIHFIQDRDMIAAIFATNTLELGQLYTLEKFIHKLLTYDLEDLYIHQVEKSLEEGSSESGLGLISMVKDYGAILGWKISDSKAGSGFVTVTTMARVKV